MALSDLKGSGTKDDPYLINEYWDWMRIEITPEKDEEMGLYFKLMNDINMITDKNRWAGKDLNHGYFDMNGHNIIGINLGWGEYIMRNCKVYSVAETWTATGDVRNEGVGGWFIDIRGTNARGAFIDCDLEYIYIDLNDFDKWSQGNDSMLSSITTKGCYIRIYNNQIINIPFITGKNIHDGARFVDTCFEINGYLSDAPFISAQNKTLCPPETLFFDHCMFKGVVDFKYMSYAAGSTDIDFLYNGVNECIFHMRNGNKPKDNRGYRTYAGSYHGVNIGLPSIYTEDETETITNGLNVYSVGDVVTISYTDMLDPTKTIDTGLDIVMMETKKEEG